MQKKLLGIIIMYFDATGQLLIVYSAFVGYLRKSGNTVRHLFTHLNEGYVSVRREVLCNILMKFGIPMKPARLIKNVSK
jgi:hypothetical protein